LVAPWLRRQALARPRVQATVDARRPLASLAQLRGQLGAALPVGTDHHDSRVLGELIETLDHEVLGLVHRATDPDLLPLLVVTHVESTRIAGSDQLASILGAQGLLKLLSSHLNLDGSSLGYPPFMRGNGD
jgi:hypothetical protein